MLEEAKTLPAIALRDMTVMPDMVAHFDISREKSIKAIEKTMLDDQVLFVVPQIEAETEEPTQEELFQVGTIVEIKQVVKLPQNVMRILVVGRKRAQVNEIFEVDGYLSASINALVEEPIQVTDDISKKAMSKSLKELYKRYASMVPKIKKETVKQVVEISDLEELIDAISANLYLDFEDMQELLEAFNYDERYELVSFKLINEIQILNIKEEIQAKVKERVDKHQREYILREQMKLIREELGEDSSATDADEFLKAVESLKANANVKEKIKKEIRRFKNGSNNSAENGVIRTYIETMLEMPWNKFSRDNTDLNYAKKVLEKDHYGLEDVKERILEYLAVRSLTKKGITPILCLVGPPGTGKTSIARSLAEALKKKYVRIALGGVRDEAEIRGHRRTYVGAMPGRIVNGIKSAGVKNPLMLLDEIDKVSKDYKGDTFSALLEVLDGEQNNKFRDHYLETAVDLSDVLFVATANSLQTIPRPLLDRMEIIEVSSYTENEKMHIAKQHLLPKQLSAHGLTEKQLVVSKGAVWKIAKNYTKEAGVRQLERKLGEVCRKAAREFLETEKAIIRVKETNLEKYLGKEKYRFQMKNEEDEVGIVRGLAWTSVGGDTLQIEVNVLKGKGKVTLTGQLGNVMKESASAAISYIRSIGKAYGISDTFFEEHEIHVHIPEGAVPKDGPSAGITMALAILSAVTEKKVRADVAMTGEITLRGRVLPIGGLKEKLLAAKNAGIKTVIVPIDNKKDVEEIAKEVTDGLEIVYAEHMKKVCEVAFVSEGEK